MRLTQYQGLEGVSPAERHASVGLLDAPVHGREVVADHAHLHEAEVQVQRDVVTGIRVGAALEVDGESGEERGNIEIIIKDSLRGMR